MRKVERDLTCTQAALAIDSAPADANERLTASVIAMLFVERCLPRRMQLAWVLGSIAAEVFGCWYVQHDFCVF